MQCSSCRFENMPGVQSCGRCGASLSLAALAINVHPPRASAWAKRWRRLLPYSRFSLRTIGRAVISELFGQDAASGPEVPVLLRAVIPGWSQTYQGNRLRGRCFFALYLGCVCTALLFAGSTIGSVFLGLAVSVHVSSVLDIVLPASRQLRTRFAYSLLCCAWIALVVYLPVGWLASGVAAPRQILQTMSPFQRGDVVLVNRWAYGANRPQPGDVVLYRIGGGQVRGQTIGLNTRIVLEGERIDRILAGAGQEFVWEGGAMAVDGRPVSYRPLNPARMPAQLKMTVPANYVLIMPTAGLADRYDLNALNWQAVSLVPEHELLGKVYLRHYPLWRLWWIR
jgi:hypothetical protein